MTNYKLGFLCKILYKYVFCSLLRENFGCFVVSLLNGSGLLILFNKVAVDKDWHIFASSFRRLSTCFTGVVRLGQELWV